MRKWLLCLFLGLVVPSGSFGEDLVPPLEEIKPNHPRVFLRPDVTSYAIALSRLDSLPRDAEYQQMLVKLKDQKHAAAQALAWLLTGDTAYADSAIARMRRYAYSGGGDTFDVYAGLTEFGLAYDWLYNYPAFTPEIKAEVRGKVLPLALAGLQTTYDHIFHNYIWMSAGGTILWALATAGEDRDADDLFDKIRDRFNTGLFPAMEYLDGLPGESMGYWSMYDFTSAVLAVLATQCAFETDLTGLIRTEHGDWLNRQYLNEIHSVLPDMRYLPWGDVISGPNGGVTHEMAGTLDAAAWALNSPEGVYFSRWLAGKRGLNRFYGETAMYYFLYTRNLTTEPAVPPLSYLAGGDGAGGHFIARSGWDDGGTVVALGCKDHYGDHNHYDQGSFTIYRNGLLAVDPTVYNKVRGPQQPTEVHNTLLINGQGQRNARGQWFETLDEFKNNLNSGENLETGDFLFYRDSADWAAAVGQFAQAYTPEALESCVRQILFIRPGKILVVDHLVTSYRYDSLDVQWLLQFPANPSIQGSLAGVTKGASWIRCTPVLPGDSSLPAVKKTDVGTYQVSYSYGAEGGLELVHLVEVGDGQLQLNPSGAQANVTETAVEVKIGGRKFIFDRTEPFEVHEAESENPGSQGSCDFNRDGKLNVLDVVSFILSARSKPGDLRLDRNGDGKYSIEDAIALLLAIVLGTCPDKS